MIRLPDMSDREAEIIRQYAEAYRQEFEEANSTKEATATIDPNDADLINRIDELVPDAMAVVRTILKHGHTEGVRATMARWLIDKKLDLADKKQDPLTEFLTEMQKAANSPQEPITKNDEA